MIFVIRLCLLLVACDIYVNAQLILTPRQFNDMSFVHFQATAQLKQAFKDPAIIPALCAVMSGSQNPQVLCE